MKYKKLKLSAILLLGLGLTSIQAQTMYVNENSGTLSSYALSNLQKMTFSGGNATIKKADNSTVSLALSGLRYINFASAISSVDEPIELANSSSLTVYPNPVGDVLSIDLNGLKNKQGILRVFSFDGSAILAQPTQGTATETINLSGLSKGIYFCQFSNENEIQTVKIIKY